MLMFGRYNYQMWLKTSNLLTTGGSNETTSAAEGGKDATLQTLPGRAT